MPFYILLVLREKTGLVKTLPIQVKCVSTSVYYSVLRQADYFDKARVATSLRKYIYKDKADSNIEH